MIHKDFKERPSGEPEAGERLLRYALFVRIPFEGYDLFGSSDNLDAATQTGYGRDFDEHWFVIDQETRMVCASGMGLIRNGD